MNLSNKKNLVLCSGGIKGIAHIGVLYGLYKLGRLDQFDNFVGSSVGSLIVSLHILGYNPMELYDFIKCVDLNKLKVISILNIPFYGLDNGSNFNFVVQKLIKSKGFDENITLSELFNKTQKNLFLVAVCLNTMEVCYISHLTFPDIPLYMAIRMSASIPFIYCPVEYDGKLYIDGGCLDPYPISYFSNDKERTLGILFSETTDTIEKIDNMETYIMRVLQCLLISKEQSATPLYSKYKNCTIKINIDSINLIDFSLDDLNKDELFIKGYQAIITSVANII